MGTDPVSHFIQVRDGLRLHARLHGEPDDRRLPVVCLPGLSRTAEDFDRLARHLAAEGRRVLALDYRGRGLSAWDPEPRNYDLQVESNDIADVLTALGITRATFVGTSRGGLHIMLLGALRPAFLAAAVLNDIGPVIDPAGLTRIKGYIGKAPPLPDWDATLAALKRIGAGHFTDLDEAEWRAYAELTFQEKDGRIVGRYDPGLMVNLAAMDLDKVPELWPQFDGLAALPLLVVRGANSDLLSPATAAIMLARHPGAALVTVAGQGHAPLLRDAPTIDRIAAFVARQDGQAGQVG
ncbi:alpha/beta hydrolase [Lichenihabitans sp. Uapishka_5]|uniref:alpha/beta fold hydrolase n=1 Tax=Lichenihabitans sp. Uapishka_5 TaxID=3037302 RepID=UPI0029E80769|nr:alpha/beta hydrolase [Lichenihabitans sp. Uapishka_5]MDX7950756.1 alpha/beta hydrolase [Lichenihabitans sp. Uapishka_5]